MSHTPELSPALASIIAPYSSEIRDALLNLRALIYEVAASTEGVGPLDEMLKWQQPSFLTQQSKSGTTIRIDRTNVENGDYGLFVSCQSNLVEVWRQRYPHLTYTGNRGIYFSLNTPFPTEEAKHCVAMALTYHLRKKNK